MSSLRSFTGKFADSLSLSLSRAINDEVSIVKNPIGDLG